MMEQQLPNEESLFELQVDFESGNYLKEAAKWAKFIAIVFFVIIGLFALAFMVSGALIIDQLFAIPGFGDSFGAFGSVAGAAGGVILAVIFIFLGLFTLINVLVYRFASRIQTGIQRQDQATFNSGWKSLRIFLIISGVIALLLLLVSFLNLLANFF